MKTKIICLLLPLFLLSCSKKSASDSTTESPTEINGMADNQDITASSALPFQVTTVWPDSESRQMIDTQKSAAAFLNAKDFDKLDELAAKLRTSKECYANGHWKLADVYAGLVPSDNASDDQWKKPFLMAASGSRICSHQKTFSRFFSGKRRASLSRCLRWRRPEDP